MQSADLAIQIVNYKTKSFLDPLIESIFKDLAGSHLKTEINILDNASGDNLEDIGKKWHDHDVNIYKSDRNGGFGAGHNLLAGKTKATYLLILNPDLLLIEEHSIERLLRTFKQTGAAVVGPRLLTPRSAKDIYLKSPPADQLKQQLWDHGTHYLEPNPYYVHNDLTEVAWVSGAVLLISRQEFLDIGGFDEKFFLYYEEIDLCRQLRKKQQRIMYDPNIQILHYGSAVAKKFSLHMLKSLLHFELKSLRQLF